MHKSALHLIPVAYFILDEAGRIADANELACELLRCERSELSGRAFSDLLAPTDTWRFLRHLRLAAQSSRRETVRLELHRSDESHILAHLHLVVDKNENNQAVGYHVAAVTAAAELLAAKEAAEEMSRLKSAFLANMSHEIRTPLTGIIGFATVLSKELPEEQKEFAELIRTSGRRLMEMLNSVLDLAKLEANQMQLDQQRLDLIGETKKVVDILRPLAEEKDLALVFASESSEPLCVRGDRAALHRILHNLVGNAIKFTEEGHVEVGVWIDGDRAGIDVADTGVGMDAEFLPHLFEEFRQESSGVMRSHQGSGLGLAITRRLVDLMGAEIEVESEKGDGSVFRVTFARNPQDKLCAPEKVDLPVVAHTSGAAPARLLLVEDHPDTQQLLLELLEDMYDVSVASGAAEAYLLATQRPFDMILMDIDLGEGPDGAELLQQLRAMPEYAATPIVAVTAFALPGDRERFLDLGFTAYVSKPFDVDELIRLPLQLS